MAQAGVDTHYSDSLGPGAEVKPDSAAVDEAVYETRSEDPNKIKQWLDDHGFDVSGNIPSPDSRLDDGYLDFSKVNDGDVKQFNDQAHDTHIQDLNQIEGGQFRKEPATVVLENTRGATYVAVYDALTGVDDDLDGGRSDSWKNIAVNIQSAKTDFAQALQTQEALDEWKGKTHDAAMDNVRQSFPELGAITNGAQALAVLIDSFGLTMHYSKDYVYSVIGSYQTDLQRFPHQRDEVNHGYDSYAERVLNNVYGPGLLQIASNNPSFTSGQKPDLTDPTAPDGSDGDPLNGDLGDLPKIDLPKDLTDALGLSDLGPDSPDNAPTDGLPRLSLPGVDPPPGIGPDGSGLTDSDLTATPPLGLPDPMANGPDGLSGAQGPDGGALGGLGGGFGGALDPNAVTGQTGPLGSAGGSGPSSPLGALGPAANAASGLSSPLSSALGAASDAAKQALGGARPNAGSLPEGALGLGPKDINSLPPAAKDAAPAGGGGGAGLGGRSLDPATPAGAPVATSSKGPGIANLNQQGLTGPLAAGKGSGWPPGSSGGGGGGGGGAGQRGGPAKEHKLNNKELRNKKNGKAILGEVETVVPVMGDDGPAAPAPPTQGEVSGADATELGLRGRLGDEFSRSTSTGRAGDHPIQTSAKA